MWPMAEDFGKLRLWFFDSFVIGGQPLVDVLDLGRWDAFKEVA